MLARFLRFDRLNIPDQKSAPNTAKVRSWIWFFAKPHKWELGAYMAMQLLRQVFFMSSTLYITKIAEIYETGKVNDSPSLPFYILGSYLFIAMLCYALWPLILRRISINDKISREFSLYAIRHYMGMSLSWHELSGSGGKMQRITNARSGLFELFQSMFWDGSEFIAIFISVVISVYFMDMPLYFVALFYGYIISYLWVSYVTGNWLIKLTNKYFKTLETLTSKVYEFVNSIATVKVFNLQNHLMHAGAEKEINCHRAFMGMAQVRGLRWALTDMVATFWIIGVSFLCLFEINRGEMSVSAFVMVALFMMSIWNRLGAFTRMYGNLIEYYIAVKRLVYNLAVRPSIKNRADAADLSVSEGRIHFDHIAFEYSEGHSIIHALNFDIKPHQKVGLIGGSGAGKTTLVKLLMRFYDVKAGALRIDGQDIRDVTLESLRENVAIIPQDISLFNHSVLDNIRYGRMAARDEEVVEAAKKAYAHDFIEGLPDGYDTLVGERGVKLSGGQRQRIAIARAILKDAPILVLDEATSALDSESERLIQESLKELMEGKTVLAIAHRLSTINHLDRLIIMNEGKIVEDGSHEELLKNQQGLYAKLWQMQSGGFVGK
jgi:ATP-binding cassette subfamily B protein|tara:strand:+ start:47862 stop:49676 length:1815 start_codon:yes stop_codon:yes gene_type:complete